MKIEDLKERTVYHYQAKVYDGKGEMIQKYRDKRKKADGSGGTWWVVIHDKVRNKSVTVRPSQVFKRKPAPRA